MLLLFKLLKALLPSWEHLAGYVDPTPTAMVKFT